MATEKRPIDANNARVVAQRIYSDPVLIHAILNTLDNTPTVDAAPVVHGRWDMATDGDGVVCSVCGTDFCILLNETDGFKYCPNCGARMDGGSDNE